MLNISNIQHFSVGDGEGIRTTVFCKGCNLRCPWCHNPENLTQEPVVLHYQTANKTEILGRLVCVEEILSDLLEDLEFYRESNGGITVSGGEAMLQTDALIPLVSRLKENGISVLIDTAGCVPYSDFQKINRFVSGYLFDFKTADPKQYHKIGGNLTLVTENLRQLLKDHIPITVRIPLIPHFNTDRNSVLAICEHLQVIGINHVDLLPFHRLGSAKYEAMGLAYAYQNEAPFSNKELASIADIYKAYFTVKIEK